MSSLNPTVFALPHALRAKADPALIGADEEHFRALGTGLAHCVAEAAATLEETLGAPGGRGRAALDRDQEVHRLSARLRTLRRFGLDLCLGRMVHDDGQVHYVGRLGLTDAVGQRLLVDWRAPAAEPFFAATHANAMGLASRRRYRWHRGRIVDFWDEVFVPDALEGHAALDDQSAFIAGLGAARSPRMRDVLATIASDQDAIVRAGSRGALVVDGGPGTGKTVVALHRAAYLLYSDPRLRRQRGGVLFVGPSRPYLNYVADVLPSLGEEGVAICTLADLVAQGVEATPEGDPQVARLKAAADPRRAVDAAVRLYEEPPTAATVVETDWGNVRIGVEDWTEVFAALDDAVPHNYARDGIWAELLALVRDRLEAKPVATSGADPNAAPDADEDVGPTEERLRRVLQRDENLVTVVNRAWPLLDPGDLVGDLWTVPAYLRRCAPWLDAGEVRALQRPEAQAWTVEDLPWLDAARQRLGDPDAERRRARKAADLAAERDRMADVLENILHADDDGEGAVAMLHGADLQGALLGDGVLRIADPDVLAGPFLHVVVDEAQELTDAQWTMLLARCPSRSFTIVGDRAQARRGFAESWRERLGRIGLDRVELATLGVNYRTPEEVMAYAEPVIRAVLPDANVPRSIRTVGIPVHHGSLDRRDAILADWLAANEEGTACVIGDPSFEGTARVRSLTPELSKGLEFDLVVLVEPERFGTGTAGAVDRYVAMTRATRELAVLTRP